MQKVHLLHKINKLDPVAEIRRLSPLTNALFGGNI